MRLLAIEYACAGGEGGAPFLEEGKGMLSALLRELSLADLGSVTTILAPGLDGSAFPATRQAWMEGDFSAAVSREMVAHDAVWITAPETGGRLLALTRLAESRGITVIGPASGAVKTCGDKLLTFKALDGALPMPESAELDVSWERFPCVVKPADGAGCEHTYYVENRNGLRSLGLPDRKFIVQPFVAGEAMSAAFVSRDGMTRMLGACRQRVAMGREVRFAGVEGPVKYAAPEKLAAMAAAIRERIPGLDGYWGIDVIDTADGPVLVEVNPRLTSSYPLYCKSSPFNIASYAVDGKRQ